jgi:hypothetical protein
MILFTGLAANTKSLFAGYGNYYKISVNGNMILHPGYYDAGYFSGFNFVNANKPSGSLKNITPNGQLLYLILQEVTDGKSTGYHSV